MKVILALIASSKSAAFKIKYAALSSISEFGNRYSHLTVPVLGKMLRDSTFSIEKVAETLLKVGDEGERVLIKVLSEVKNQKEHDEKLKVAIIKVFEQFNIRSPNIDFVIETLYLQARYYI